jgi:YHS domain-containing protein
MLRLLLLLVLIVLLARGFWRMVDGIVEGLTGRRSTGVPGRGVQMVRDPVCGTFVLPERALTLSDGRQRIFFCSATCRDKYRARTA